MSSDTSDEQSKEGVVQQRLVSRFWPDAKVCEKRYWCPYCGKPTFSSKVAVWCSESDLEGGTCEYKLLSG